MLCYQDDGLGIDGEHIDKIFEPFFTTDSASGGTGLGLNIAYNLVTQRLGGSIECTSHLGQGVRFNIILSDCK